MNDKITIILLGLLLTNAVGWCIYVSITLTKIQNSIKYLNGNIRLIDWEKIPRKNLNDII